MEQTEQMEEKKKAAQKLTMRIVIALTVVVAAYVIYALVTKNINILIFEILLGIFVVAYLVLSDVVEPWMVGLFQKLTPARRNGYLKMMAMDVIGAGALLYWIVGMNSETGNDILIPVLIYFFSAQMKRKFRPEFEGTLPEIPEEPVEEENFEAEEETSDAEKVPDETEDTEEK